MHATYRINYPGEFVVYNTLLDDGQYQESREWIPNTIVNNSHNRVAVILGNGASRTKNSLAPLARHKYQRPELRLQTYGCNALIRDFAPDFLVLNSECLVSEVLQYQVTSTTSVITTAKIIMANSNRFHMIPGNLNWNAGAVATFLACFDGHKRVYLLGMDNQVPGKNNNVYAGTPCYDSADTEVSSEKWERNMYDIFRAYPDVDFVRIKPGGTTPRSWQSCLNYRQISYRDFVLEVDL